jgi:hypothetical protein
MHRVPLFVFSLALSQHFFFLLFFFEAEEVMSHTLFSHMTMKKTSRKIQVAAVALDCLKLVYCNADNTRLC